MVGLFLQSLVFYFSSAGWKMLNTAPWGSATTDSVPTCSIFKFGKYTLAPNDFASAVFASQSAVWK